MRIPSAIFTKQVKKEKCEIHIKSQNTCPQTILNKNKAENISLPNFLIHYKATAFRAICYWYRNKLICVIEQTTRTTSIDLWANGCWKTKWPHVEEWNWTLTLFHSGKSTQNRLEKIKYESIKLLKRWTFMKVIWAVFFIYWVTIRSTGKQSQVRWIPHQIKMPLTIENKINRDKKLPMEYGEVCSYPTITHCKYVIVAWHITLDEVRFFCTCGTYSLGKKNQHSKAECTAVPWGTMSQSKKDGL